MPKMYTYSSTLTIDPGLMDFAAQSLDDLGIRISMLLPEDDPLQEEFETLSDQYEALDEMEEGQRDEAICDVLVGVAKFADKAFPSRRSLGGDTAGDIAATSREMLKRHSPRHFEMCGGEMAHTTPVEIEHVAPAGPSM